MSLSDRVSRGTARQRRAAFAVGLWSLALVNFLDLAGLLRLGLDWTSVGWLSLALLLVPMALADEFVDELSGMGRVALWTVLWAGVLLVGARVTNPDVGGHYLVNATALGMASQATLQAAAVPMIVAGLLVLPVRAFAWLLDYHYLRSTTPEERVLGDQSGGG